MPAATKTATSATGTSAISRISHESHRSPERTPVAVEAQSDEIGAEIQRRGG